MLLVEIDRDYYNPNGDDTLEYFEEAYDTLKKEMMAWDAEYGVGLTLLVERELDEMYNEHDPASRYFTKVYLEIDKENLALFKLTFPGDLIANNICFDSQEDTWRFEWVVK